MAKRLGRPPGLTPDGPKIKRLRVSRGWTAAQLAPRVGLHPKSLMATESANRSISDVTAARLAMALSTPDETVTVADLLAKDGGDESEPEPKALAS